MAYFKLTILSILVFIGIIHGPVHVSCQIYPSPPVIGPPNIFPSGNGISLFPGLVLASVLDLDRRSDERLTVILVNDNRLQNGVEFEGGFGVSVGGGFGSMLALLFIPCLLMALGFGVNTTTTIVTDTTTIEVVTTTPAVAVVTPAATSVTTAVASTTAPPTTPLDNNGGAGLAVV